MGWGWTLWIFWRCPPLIWKSIATTMWFFWSATVQKQNKQDQNKNSSIEKMAWHFSNSSENFFKKRQIPNLAGTNEGFSERDIETNIFNWGKRTIITSIWYIEKTPDTYIFAHYRYERWSAELCLKRASPLPTISGDYDDGGWWLWWIWSLRSWYFNDLCHL